MGTRNMVGDTLDKAFKDIKYQGFEKIAPASLLLNDFDMHVGNIGVIRIKDSEELPELVRIDFAGSLLKLSNKIAPNSHLNNMPLLGPTNHYREFPRFLKNNHPFADSLLAASKFDINSTIDKSFQEISKYYSDTALLGWAKKSMPAKFDYSRIKELDVNIIKEAFKEIMNNRQESLQEYGLQIKLGLLIQEKDKSFQVNKDGLKKLIEEYPKYFEKIILKPDALKLRMKVSFIDNLLNKKAIQGILFKEIKEAYKVTVKEKKARDKIKSIPHSSLKVNINQEIAQKPQPKAQQSKVEQVNTQEKPSNIKTIVPIKWQAAVVKVDNTIIRSVFVKSLNIRIKEINVITPIYANNIYIAKYRKIDFPLALDPSLNNIDLVFAVKEVSGKNINAKNAKYFSAHYKQGTLVSMSYPEPLKFVSTDKDAIGYCTGDDGKIYTVPVTLGTFNEMTKQIQENKKLEQKNTKNQLQSLVQKSHIITDKLKSLTTTSNKQASSVLLLAKKNSKINLSFKPDLY